MDKSRDNHRQIEKKGKRVRLNRLCGKCCVRRSSSVIPVANLATRKRWAGGPLDRVRRSSEAPSQGGGAPGVRRKVWSRRVMENRNEV
jgi:hypothetical protein